MDPLAEKYYNTSPYAQYGNNPVRYKDPNGKYLVDENGNIMYKDGKWLDNATDGAKRIAADWRTTEIGQRGFDSAVNADFGVELIYDTTSDIGLNGQSKHNVIDGKTADEVKNGQTVGHAKLTVFEKNVVEDLDNLSQVSEQVNNGGKSNATANQKLMMKQGVPTLDERVGQVTVHEWEHMSNPAAFQTNGQAGEDVALAAERRAIIETTLNKTLPSTFPVPTTVTIPRSLP
jgi:hypothetical protein